jgi:hypothetical protein
MDQIPDHPVYSKNVLEMLTVANDFIVTLKRVETIEKKKLLEYLTKVSPLLYLKGALLPGVKVKNRDMNERFYTEEEWEILFNTLRKILGAQDIFWYADKETSDELIKGSISEQLTDIFQDLQDFLLLYQKNSLDAKENAVYEVQHLFVTNWGIKVLMIQKPLHQLYFGMPQEEVGFDIPPLF